MTDKEKTMRTVIGQLVEALKDAESHLDYVGYGDSYEREIAKEENLEENIKDALEKGRDFLAGEGISS